jgi:hypothetical protein
MSVVRVFGHYGVASIRDRKCDGGNADGMNGKDRTGRELRLTGYRRHPSRLTR